MATLCFVLGQSGTGKSRSLKNFSKDELAHVNVCGKPLPFKGKFDETLISHDYEMITRFIKNCSAKSIAIDDSTFLMSFQKWDKAFEKNFDKWTELGKNFTDLLRTCVFDVASDKIVYFIHHTDSDDNGKTFAKCLGKMINQDATLEAFFTIVLTTTVVDGKYYFLTQNNGRDTTKSPEGMFPSYAIDNDLKYVDDKIRNYYELGDYKSDTEMTQADEEVAADLEKPDAKGRRSRSKKADAAKEEKSKRTRKSRSEVIQENEQKVEKYLDDVDEAVDKVSDGADEVPYETAVEAAETVPEPDLQKPPRRTRKERKAEEVKEEPEVLTEDTYFYIAANDNFVMKHKGDIAPEGGKVITKEEFGEGVKRIAQENNPAPATESEPLDGQMTPPEERTRRRRRVRA